MIRIKEKIKMRIKEKDGDRRKRGVEERSDKFLYSKSFIVFAFNLYFISFITSEAKVD